MTLGAKPRKKRDEMLVARGVARVADRRAVWSLGASQRLAGAARTNDLLHAVFPRRVMCRWAAIIGLICLVFAQPDAIQAQQPSGSGGLQQLFEEVQKSTATSDIMQKLAGPFADDAPGDPSNEAELPPPAAARPRGQATGQRFVAPNRTPGATSVPSSVEGTLPMVGSGAADDVQLSQNNNGLITLVVRDASLSRVLALLAQTQGLNVVASNDIDALISITLHDVPLEDALTAILSVANYTWVRKNNIILVTSLADGISLPASVQGRQIQVFDLDFANATSVAEAITQFLSPIGKVSFSESDPLDNRKTREAVVVEDMPEVLARIAAYINYVDQPPRQVQIEAHILQVTLDDTNRQGVDFAALFRLANQRVNIISVPSLAVPIPQPGVPPPDLTTPALVATLSGGDLNAVIELLQTTTDAKSLGSPRVLVLNEQEARIQVGKQEGYKTSTTTETSTIEQVQFLETGVILTIRPRISRDNRVLLHVRPEVSDGTVNAQTGLPEEETTQVETTIMLESGQGMVIGGLIKEEDSVVQSKVPYLGDVKGLGWFFRKSTVTKERVEVIVAIIPRVQPFNPDWQAYEEGNLVKAGVPLMDGPLCRTYRPFDPVLPDGKRVYRPLIPPKPLWEPDVPCYPRGTDYYTPRHPLPQQNFYGEECDPMFDQPSVQSAPFLSDESLPPPQPIGPRDAGDPFGTEQQ